MATRRKSTARKKSLPKTKKIGGKTYTKKACSKLKTAATSKAKKIRAGGQKARVLKNPTGGYCVFVAGRKKKARKKRA